MKYFLFISAVIFSVCACTSTRYTVNNTTFHTRITSGNLKHFKVTLAQEHTEKDNEPPSFELPPPRGRGQRPKKQNHKKIKQQLISIAREHLAINHFCREDFWVININYFGPVPTLKGECNEAASDEDKKQFKNTIKKW